MERIIIFIACIITVLNPKTVLANESNLYVNQKLGISIKGPDGWSLAGGDEKFNELVAFRNSDDSGIIGLQYFVNESFMFLQDYVNKQIEHKKERAKEKWGKEIVLVDLSETKLNDTESMQVLYEVSTVYLGMMHMLQNYFYDSKRKIVYLLTLSSPKEKYEENKNIFDEVIKTLEIK